MTDTDKQNSTVGKRQTRYSSTKQTTQNTAKHKTKLPCLVASYDTRPRKKWGGLIVQCSWGHTMSWQSHTAVSGEKDFYDTGILALLRVNYSSDRIVLWHLVSCQATL